MRRTVIRDGALPAYWVEAKTAVKTGKVIGYSVVCKTEEEGRTYLKTFRCQDGGWQVALHLANMMRDDLNAGIE